MFPVPTSCDLVALLSLCVGSWLIHFGVVLTPLFSRVADSTQCHVCSRDSHFIFLPPLVASRGVLPSTSASSVFDFSSPYQTFRGTWLSDLMFCEIFVLVLFFLILCTLFHVLRFVFLGILNFLGKSAQYQFFCWIQDVFIRVLQIFETYN